MRQGIRQRQGWQLGRDPDITDACEAFKNAYGREWERSEAFLYGAAANKRD